MLPFFLTIANLDIIIIFLFEKKDSFHYAQGKIGTRTNSISIHKKDIMNGSLISPLEKWLASAT
jgi:hypothetical protein